MNKPDSPAPETVVAYRWDGGSGRSHLWCAECNAEFHGDAGDADQELTADDVTDGAVCDACLRNILTGRLTT